MSDTVQKQIVWPELSDIIRGFTSKLSPSDHQLIQTWINGRMNAWDDVSERHPSKEGEFVCVSTAKATNILAAYGGKIRTDGYQAASQAIKLLDEYVEEKRVSEDEELVARMRVVFTGLRAMTAPVVVPPVS
jgi:hypothetical protein